MTLRALHSSKLPTVLHPLHEPPIALLAAVVVKEGVELGYVYRRQFLTSYCAAVMIQPNQQVKLYYSLPHCGIIILHRKKCVNKAYEFMKVAFGGWLLQICLRKETGGLDNQVY